MNGSASVIWFILSTTRRIVSVAFTRDLSCAGKAGKSISCILTSSYFIVPSWGWCVVNSWGEIFVFCSVNISNRVDFPVFVNPVRIVCMSAFFTPFLEPADFFCFARFCLSFFNLVFRFLNMFSADLCFGHSLIIISRQAILSSSVVARRKSCSAL